MMQQRFTKTCLGVIVSCWVWLAASTVQADTLTRHQVQIMHDNGIRMALARADGTSEPPYVVPADIKPELLLQTELLDFSGRTLTQIPSWLVKFKNLRKLDLSNTGLPMDTNLLAVLSNMPELSVLQLSGNPLFPEKKCWWSCDPVVTLGEVWQKLPQLTELGLTNIGASAENLGSLAPLTNLSHLYLGGNRIGDDLAKLGLKTLPNLRVLNLQSNGMKADPLPFLPTASLVELSLAQNDLSELAFVDLPQLVNWDIGDNPRIKLAVGFGDMFALGSLDDFSYDSAAQLPDALAKRISAKRAAAEALAEQAEQERRKAEALATIKGIKMVSIPSGSFIMGCKEGRDDVEGACQSDEKPAHEVSIQAFQLAATEVTFDQWDACEQANVCPHVDDAGWGRGSRPVINVSWEDTQVFIKWLNETLKPVQPFRLPTEAEWEYAARGGGDGAYPWGQQALHNYANYGADQCCAGYMEGKDQWEYTSPVGQFPMNGFGVFDMHGNVWEWVQDWYQDDYYRSSPASAPEGPSSGTDRVVRGGSWLNYGQRLRSADRYYGTPDARDYGVGFRLALG